MNELVRVVQEKTGLSEEQSRKAVEVVMQHLHGVLPQPIANQLEHYLSEHEQSGQSQEGVAGALKGMLGR